MEKIIVRLRLSKGFTLSELLLAAAILAFVLSGILYLFFNIMVMNESNLNLNIAFNAIQLKMEELRNSTYDNLTIGTTHFELTGLTAASSDGSYTIDEPSADLKRVKIVACFMNRNRLVGDNINNCHSSPQAEIGTFISR